MVGAFKVGLVFKGIFFWTRISKEAHPQAAASTGCGRGPCNWRLGVSW